jgi:patatin-like phospholipase/acyl hydrolase
MPTHVSNISLTLSHSTGGIIAIGLGVKKWTVSSSIEKFKDLCREAFTPREMRSVPVFGALSSLYHGSLYKTQPFTKALARYFSDQPLFGGRTHRSRFDVSLRVAVTATTSMEKQDVVFANYNRPDPVGKRKLPIVSVGLKLIVLSVLPYRFTRSDVPFKEVRMWEA